jgi:hypothetical protein
MPFTLAIGHSWESLDAKGLKPISFELHRDRFGIISCRRQWLEGGMVRVVINADD